MKMKFLGSTSGGGSCPNVYETDANTIVVQGGRVSDPELLAIARERGLPDHETLVEIPRELVQYFPQELLDKYATGAR